LVGLILDVSIYMYNSWRNCIIISEELEGKLKGEIRKKRWLNSEIDGLYDKEKVQSPGVNSEDFLKAMKVEE